MWHNFLNIFLPFVVVVLQECIKSVCVRVDICMKLLIMQWRPKCLSVASTWTFFSERKKRSKIYLTFEKMMSDPWCPRLQNFWLLVLVVVVTSLVKPFKLKVRLSLSLSRDLKYYYPNKLCTVVYCKNKQPIVGT